MLSASESILAAYAGGKVMGYAKGIAGKVSPKLKSISNKLVGKAKNSYKPIEDIEVGDYVWSENISTGEIALKEVTETYIYSKEEVVLIYVGNELIETTKEHPFYVKDKGWKIAGDLEVGEVLILLNGTTEPIDKIEIRKLNEKVNVYNFEVEDFHTYFVGENGVLVHNDCSYSVNSSNSKLREACKLANKYTMDNDLYEKHILRSHGPESIRKNKSRFNADFDIKGEIDSALKGGNSFVDSNSYDRKGYVFRKTYPTPIGIDKSGYPAHTLKVVISENGEVITAYPMYDESYLGHIQNLQR